MDGHARRLRSKTPKSADQGRSENLMMVVRVVAPQLDHSPIWHRRSLISQPRRFPPTNFGTICSVDSRAAIASNMYAGHWHSAQPPPKMCFGGKSLVDGVNNRRHTTRSVGCIDASGHMAITPIRVKMSYERPVPSPKRVHRLLTWDYLRTFL